MPNNLYAKVGFIRTVDAVAVDHRALFNHALVAQRTLTAAEIQASLTSFKDSVTTKTAALQVALDLFKRSLANDITTISQLIDVLDNVQTALELLPDLEEALEEYRDFMNDHGSYISVTNSVVNDLEQAARWVIQARDNLIAAEQGLLRSFSDSYASRVELSVDNAIDWDESPTMYQATSIAHGHMLCYSMRLKANGYSLGDLLNTFSLGPCQKKQISILEFGREETARRTEALDMAESLESTISRDRDINEVLKSSLSEKIKGSSRSKSFGLSGGAGVSANGSGQKGPLKIAAGITSGLMGSMGVSGASSSQQASRNIASSSMQRLRERINQSSSSVRSQRATVVESMTQTERVSATTEVIANKNLCHSMNFMFFEVLKHFVIEQELVGVQEVLFIPLKITTFTPEKILRWQDILFDFVPGPDLRAGFADIAALESGNAAPNRLLADESIRDMSGHMVISFDLPLPEMNDPDLAKDDDPIPENHYFGSAWSFYRGRFSIFTHNFYRSYLYGRSHRARQQVWENQMVPKIVNEFLSGLSVFASTPTGEINLKLDITQLTKFRHGARMSVKLATTPDTPPIRRADIQALEIRSERQVPSNARIIIEAASLTYRAESLNGTVFRDNHLRNDIGNADTTYIVTPLNAEEMRNPAIEQTRRANTLVEHLNSNREIYHEILFKEMDEQRRFMLLDGIRLPSAGDRSVANLVENRVVEVVGNSIVMPVAQGMRIDPIFHEIEDLLDFYLPEEPAEPFRLSLSTGGWFMEAVMGTCNSCEELDYTKARFNGFACDDEPSEIKPISMASRRADPSNLQAKDFASSLAAFQSIPNAPDPTDLGVALQAISKGDAFRDATGLSATQANAIAALAKTADGAEAMAKISADLTKQAFAGIADVTADRDIARIESQAAKGNITDEQKNKFIEEILGGKAKSTSPASESKTTESLLDKAESALSSGDVDTVTLSETDEDGKTITIKIERNP